MLGKNNVLTLQNFLLFLCLTGLFMMTSCKKDQIDLPLQYDPALHIYGTMDYPYDGRWEIIVDVQTGDWDSIPETNEYESGYNLPLGTKVLTDFSGNKKIYLNLHNVLVVQDLSTFETTKIELLDPEEDRRNIQRPTFLRFGENNNVVYAYSGFKQAVYRIDLITETVTLVKRDLPLGYNELDGFMYHKETNSFIFIRREQVPDTRNPQFISIYNLDMDSFKEAEPATELFGFVVHPDGEGIFALTIPLEEIGFKLVRVDITDNGFQTRTISSSKVAIDDSGLAPHRQTIHTATNSYICTGGNNSIEVPTTILYSIDLDSGALIRKVELENSGTLLKVKGE